MSINDENSKFTGCSEGAATGRMLGEVSRRMLELGATYSRDHLIHDLGQWSPFSTHFFRPDGLEIGLFHHVTGGYLVFNTPREWGESVLDSLTAPESLDKWRRE
jgi:hypothetical protein